MFLDELQFSMERWARSEAFFHMGTEKESNQESCCDGVMMNEVYTCTCGGQTFIIEGGTITCTKCGLTYTLMWDVGIDGQMESPEEFNARIRKEA